MKQRGLMTLIFITTVILLGVSALSATAAPPGKEMAVVDMQDKTHLGKAVLQGKYIFVHDDSGMAKGDPCFFVYEYVQNEAGQPEARPDKLVVSFHCEAVTHPKASQIVLTYGMTAAGEFQLREIQFAGSTEGHRVP
jgi:hypothetical protein